MTNMTTQISQGGRIVIPASVRKKMDVDIGDTLVLNWDESLGELRLSTRKQRLQHARNLVKSYAKPGASVVDSLIEDRRKAASEE